MLTDDAAVLMIHSVHANTPVHICLLCISVLNEDVYINHERKPAELFYFTDDAHVSFIPVLFLLIRPDQSFVRFPTTVSSCATLYYGIMGCLMDFLPFLPAFDHILFGVPIHIAFLLFPLRLLFTTMNSFFIICLLHMQVWLT